MEYATGIKVASIIAVVFLAFVVGWLFLIPAAAVVLLFSG
jgi:hypothetical protein